MLTLERQRKNKTTLIELKSATNMKEKDKHIEKLGGSIKASIDKLKRLRTEIQAETSVKKIASLMGQFQKENDFYNQLQISLGQVNEQSEIYSRIKKMNKEFIETYDPEELRKKFQYMKAEKTKRLKNQNFIEMSTINEQQLTGQLLASDKHAIRYKILMQEKEQLQEIERLINQVKDIATKTSIMINSQGEKIELSLQTMKNANKHLRDGKELMTQTNQYQQDTSKKFFAFCCLTVLIITIILMVMYSTRKTS